MVILSGGSTSKVQKTTEIQAFKVLGTNKKILKFFKFSYLLSILSSLNNSKCHNMILKYSNNYTPGKDKKSEINRDSTRYSF